MGLRTLLIFEICLVAIVCRAVALDKDPSDVASNSGDDTKGDISKASDQAGVKSVEQTENLSQVVRKGRQLPLPQQIDSVKNCVDQMYSGLAASRTGSHNLPFGYMPSQYYSGNNWPGPSPWTQYPIGSSSQTPGNIRTDGMTPTGSGWSNSPITPIGSMPSTLPGGPMSTFAQNLVAGYAAPLTPFSNALTGSSGRQITPFNPERVPTGSYSSPDGISGWYNQGSAQSSGYLGGEMGSLGTGGYSRRPVDSWSPERSLSGGYSSPMSPPSQGLLSGYSEGQFQAQQNYLSGNLRASEEPLPPAPQLPSMSQGPTMQQQMSVQPQMLEPQVPASFSGNPVPQINTPPQTPSVYSQLTAMQGMLKAPQLPSTDLNIPSGQTTLPTGFSDTSAVGGARTASAPPTNIASYNSQPGAWLASKPKPSPEMFGGGASFTPRHMQMPPALANSAQAHSPCPTNYLISCGPNIRSVPCS